MSVADVRLMKVLLSKNARIIIAARSQANGDAAVEELTTFTGKDNVSFLKLDLANLKSIKQAAEQFLRFILFCLISSRSVA